MLIKETDAPRSIIAIVRAPNMLTYRARFKRVFCHAETALTPAMKASAVFTAHTASFFVIPE
jgi:hypothetical protein